ncbi:uncharacterized protein [Nicotiana tomentosiformis]|uniref:uncharacterized protein n=1 Tax=Nicotiana tomentosiformis TaxID=4098 RepID=UPI00388C97B7
MAIKHNVISLEIHPTSNFSYCIPDAIYAAKTLTELSLNKCNFEIDNNNSTTNKLQRIISTCPFIRDLKIGHCTGIQNLHVFGLVNLEKLELRMCKKLAKVEIWAPNLRKFVYVGVPLDEHSGTTEPEPLPCTIDILDGYNTLECLQLEATTMTDKQFEYQLSKFPALKVLKLKRCYVMKNIKVVSENLKSFTLSHWGNLEQVNMLAPNLMEFNFQGYIMPFSISTMDPSNLERANLDFYVQQSDDSYNFGDVDTSWYNNLLDFVQKFNYSNGLILIICCEESILIYEDPSEILVPPTRKLELCIENSSMHLESFVNEMMFSQPMTVSIVHGMDSKILQAFSETTKECRMKQYKRLNEVIIHKGATEDGGTSCLNSWLKSTSLIERITTFMFKWEEPPN